MGVLMHKEVHAFTDGSSDYKRKVYGSGSVLLTNPTEEADIVSEVIKGGDNPRLMKYNNITGEVLATCYAIEEAIRLGYSTIYIYADYIGIIKWALGEWQARTDISILYKNQVTEYSKFIDIKFEKVKAHDGNKWNDYADFLAKKSIGIVAKNPIENNNKKGDK